MRARRIATASGSTFLAPGFDLDPRPSSLIRHERLPTPLAVVDLHGAARPQRRQLPADLAAVHQSAAAGVAAFAHLGAGHRGGQPEQLADSIVFDATGRRSAGRASLAAGQRGLPAAGAIPPAGGDRADRRRNSISAATTNCSGSGCGGTSRRPCTTAATTSSPPARRGR